MVKNMIRLMQGFHKLYLPTFPALNWEEKVNIKIMQENGSPIENQNDDFTNTSSTDNEYSKWVDNQGDEVKNVFGFNSSAELVNGRAAMIGFLMLILTELVFSGRPVTSSIFGIN